MIKMVLCATTIRCTVVVIEWIVLIASVPVPFMRVSTLEIVFHEIVWFFQRKNFAFSMHTHTKVYIALVTTLVQLRRPVKGVAAKSTANVQFQSTFFTLTLWTAAWDAVGRILNIICSFLTQKYQVTYIFIVSFILLRINES
jgi:hypothetical protein